jgi:hypothetical protein
MKRTYVLLFALSLLFFLIACGQNEADEESETMENGTGTEEDAAQEDAEEDEAGQEANDSQSEASEEVNEADPGLTEETVDGSMIINGYRDYEENEELITFSFHRSNQQLSLEERLFDSLKESVETDKLEELDRITVDGTTASLYFSENERLQSMASTEQLYFTDMLYAISSLYGIETLDFYVDENLGIEFGQTGTVESMEVETPQNRGFYVYGDIDGTRTYISGIFAEEIITDEAGDLMDFPETVNKMRTVQDQAFYQPGINEGIEIIDVSVQDARAEVHYNAVNAEADIADFENVLQLAALDFDFQELHLINQEEGLAKIFLFDQEK